MLIMTHLVYLSRETNITVTGDIRESFHYLAMGRQIDPNHQSSNSSSNMLELKLIF